MSKTTFELPKDKIVEFCKKNHIRRLSLFGSFLYGKFGPDSDIDFLVEFEPDHVPGCGYGSRTFRNSEAQG